MPAKKVVARGLRCELSADQTPSPVAQSSAPAAQRQQVLDVSKISLRRSNGQESFGDHHSQEEQHAQQLHEVHRQRTGSRIPPQPTEA